jgi:AraC-like DNA-binding protein/mannose-6-phosphate isomerase-like protein (cupin superfamily)
MGKDVKAIPLHTMSAKFGSGIALTKARDKELGKLANTNHAHRDDYHLFFFLESGTATLEIDFQKYKIKASAVVYIHPYQVHIASDYQNVLGNILAISNENLKPEYQNLLAEIAPAQPLVLNKKVYPMLINAFTLCHNIVEGNHEKLYRSILKDSCNTVIGLIIEQFLSLAKPLEKLNRSEQISKSFKSLLDSNFATQKSPSEYAKTLNISASYLNECVNNSTGQPSSYHIQQRIILEAKRLLFHTDKSVKEIANELGYKDYSYFSRLFSKITGMPALSFRSQNRK